LLLGGCVAARATSGSVLDSIFGNSSGAALLVDVAGRKLIAVHGTELAGQSVAPPGSTLKPLVLAALLQARQMRSGEVFECPGELALAGRSFTCSHPPAAAPFGVASALAYSCNCFVAHFAARFAAGELARSLERAGLDSRTGWLGEREASGHIAAAAAGEGSQLQALGEDRVLVTLAELALAYRRLALTADGPIREGLEQAVEFGTGHLARVQGMTVAGKTGSVRAGSGAHIAWFAGFAPSRAPEVVVAVMLQGRSGGADAAPVAGQILEAHRAGRL
jgi:cell division protein FtsI/penicillin-binding protein 2